MTDLIDSVNTPAAGTAAPQDINPLVRPSEPDSAKYLAAGHISQGDAASAWETFHYSRNPRNLRKSIA